MAYNDDETIEQLKSWWQRYGTPLLLLIAVTLFSVAGWRYWSSSRIEAASTAQTLQQQMLAAAQRLQGNPDDKTANTDLQRLGRQLVDEYGNTPYGADAALLLARRAVESGNLAEAEKQLRWVLEQGPRADTEVLVQTRLARVLAAAGKHDEALTLLAGIKAEGVTPLVDEIRGDILLLKGDRAKAAEAYRAADAALAERDEVRPVLELKLADVGLEAAKRKTATEEAQN